MTRETGSTTGARTDRAESRAFDRSSPAVVLRFEQLDPDGRAVLVRVGQDDQLAIWVRGETESSR